jgi:hypothetical protein
MIALFQWGRNGFFDDTGGMIGLVLFTDPSVFVLQSLEGSSQLLAISSR